MIRKFEISGIHTKVDKDLKVYAREKIGGLDTYLPRHARASAHAEVKIISEKQKTREVCYCEVIMYLPHSELVVKESGQTYMAAVDAVEAKLKLMLKKYKSRHSRERFHHRVISKIRRR